MQEKTIVVLEPGEVVVGVEIVVVDPIPGVPILPLWIVLR
jgi:hypothetical protein